MSKDDRDDGHDGPPEIAMVGDLTEHEGELTDRILSVPPGGECIFYFDSPGGNPYCALSLMSLMLLRGLKATGIVTGECSSAALWPFAACSRRLVTVYSVFLFHPTKSQSDENVGLAEAAEWARHFADLENQMDRVLGEMLPMDATLLQQWMHPGRYVTGREFAEAGLAELIELNPLDLSAGRKRKPGARRKPKPKATR